MLRTFFIFVFSFFKIKQAVVFLNKAKEERKKISERCGKD